MDFVTITDHNRIDGVVLLKQKYPDKVLMGVEATVRFPEDNCKIHLLIYGFTPEQFKEIDTLRQDIYALREYLLHNNLPHVVAHATYAVNSKVTKEALEKLIILFDNFETINGSRDEYKNLLWANILRDLSPEYIAQLEKKHHLQSASSTPWIKGYTGGSDDHAAIFIGRTYTECAAKDPSGIINALRQRKTIAGGRHNEFYSLAFAIYKILLDFSKHQQTVPDFIIDFLTRGFIKQYRPKNPLKRLALRLWKPRKQELQNAIIDLLQNSKDPETTFSDLYNKIAHVLDLLVSQSIQKIQTGFGKNKKADTTIKTLIMGLPIAFMAIPFFSASGHMYKLRRLVRELHHDCLLASNKNTEQLAPVRKLWFTDTITDTNGVSMFLQKQAWAAYLKGEPLSIVTSLGKQKPSTGFPPNVINLPSIHEFAMPYYESHLTLKIPSILNAIRTIYEYDVEEIIISTPGPIGLIGLAIAKLFGLPCTAIYHTDFEKQADEMTGNESETALVHKYTKWFYSMVDHIKAPTQEYIDILVERGYDRNKMSVMHRAIDLDVFQPHTNDRTALHEVGINDGPTLIFAGRLSKEKQLEFLIDIYPDLEKQYPQLNLLIIGEGPEQEKLLIKAQPYARIKILPKVQHEKLARYYAAADVLVFPSTGDTFGMVILEAQACGLPALVSDVGGPQELIIPEKTGYVIANNNATAWKNKIIEILTLIETNPHAWQEKRNASRKNAEEYCQRSAK